MASVFVSYSHKDKAWLERLQVHLRPLGDIVKVWDDTQIQSGDRWFPAIQEAIAGAKVVILLISADFLASDFIRHKELPDLLERAAAERTVVLPVIVTDCMFEETESISIYQAINTTLTALDRLNEADQNGIWVKVARRVKQIVEAPEAPKPEAPTVGNRHALILDVRGFGDPFFAGMAGERPARTEDLAAVLRDPKIGGFNVKSLEDPTCARAKDALTAFYGARRPGDVALVYLCGLAVTEANRDFRFLAADSTRLGPDDAISIDFLQELISKTRATQQLVIFDCRYAGYFPTGRINADARACPSKSLFGEGRFVLSATNQITWAWGKDSQGDPAALRDPNPWLLDVIIHGLKTGLADRDDNLKITFRELVDFLLARSAQSGPDLPGDGRPSIWASDKAKEDDFVVAKASLPQENAKPTVRKERFDVAQDIRRPILDLISPSYILDARYFLLDWNEAFDEVVAKPLKLVRGRMHAGAFIRALMNCEDVVAHSNARFGESPPLVDTELMIFDTSKYGAPFGQVCFRKIAAQITDEEGGTLGWSVNLNVKSVERDEPQFWQAILCRIESQVRWSRYAAVYDKLLLQFDDYLDLIHLVADQVGDVYRCIDMGAGTGNGSLRLLETGKAREIWAVDINETMLRHLREKLADSGVEDPKRLTIYKDNIARLDGFPASSFDAAIMINVLYAIEDRGECLRNANRILKVGGLLSLSTSYRETDVDRLFDALRDALRRKGLLEQFQEHVDIAHERHIELEALIHRDTIEDTVRMVEEAGFELEGGPRKAYVDAVVVIKARKARELAPKAVATSTPTPVVRHRDVFLSYCEEDREIADHLLEALEGQGLSCFVARRDITPAEDWGRAIPHAIDTCRVMLLILSAKASDSSFVRSEVIYATGKNVPIMPFRVAEVDPSSSLAFFVNGFHWFDAFPGALAEHIPRFLDTIRALLANSAPT